MLCLTGESLMKTLVQVSRMLLNLFLPVFFGWYNRVINTVYMFDHANKLHMYCICDSRAPVAQKNRIPRRIRRAPIGPAFAQQGSSEDLGTA